MFSTRPEERRNEALPPPIRPLSPDTIAQLRSTVNIRNISDAISELVQNSLDADAKSIKVAVNLEKNSCSVEDDGWGITAEDIKLVGQRYASSKRNGPSLSSTFGHRGEALSSLASHSLLSITSRARGYRATHMVRFSYNARAPVFAGYAPEHLRITGENASGTVARVEGLFGNFPVRLKVRAELKESELEKEWSEIVRVLSALLVTSKGCGVSLTLRDATVSGPKSIRLQVRQNASVTKPTKHHSWEVSVLRQVFGERDIGQMNDWQWVKAKKGGILIEGWVCKEPSARKAYQFISVNDHPLECPTYIHSEINTLFAQSNFGMLDTLGTDENGKIGLMRKTVEKWMKCILRIQVENSEGPLDLGGEGGTSGKAGVVGNTLEKIVKLLLRLLSEFLKQNYYRPKARSVSPLKGKITGYGTSVKGNPLIESHQKLSIKDVRPQLHQHDGSSSPQKTFHTTPTLEKGQLPLSMQGYSKIRSGRPNEREEEGRTVMKGQTFLSTPPLTDIDPVNSETAQHQATINAHSSDEAAVVKDALTTWTNPRTKQAFQINSRTGNLVLAPKGPTVSPAFAQSTRNSVKRVRLDPSVGYGKTTPWIDDLLTTWKNPIFNPPIEPSLPRATLGLPNLELEERHGCNDKDLEAAAQSLKRLSRQCVATAQVVNQVDNKFILIRTVDERNITHLILLDQHAASERVRVEALIAEACTIPAPRRPPLKPLHFAITPEEALLLERYTQRMNRWGITYKTSGKTGNDSLELLELPAAVCKRLSGEPKLAIDLVRGYLYELVNSKADTVLPSVPIATDGDASHPWLSHLPYLPTALLELLNSKACRGAIMFNDKLSRADMEGLVRSLGNAKFPFQCAHGRPSMVPLGDLGDDIARRRELYGYEESGFTEKWRQWREDVEKKEQQNEQ